MPRYAGRPREPEVVGVEARAGARRWWSPVAPWSSPRWSSAPRSSSVPPSSWSASARPARWWSSPRSSQELPASSPRRRRRHRAAAQKRAALRPQPVRAGDAWTYGCRRSCPAEARHWSQWSLRTNGGSVLAPISPGKGRTTRCARSDRTSPRMEGAPRTHGRCHGAAVHLGVEIRATEGGDDGWPWDESRPEPCERCGRPSLPIVYGLPGFELMDLATRGAVVLGGCELDDDPPNHQCEAGHPAWRPPPQSRQGPD